MDIIKSCDELRIMRVEIEKIENLLENLKKSAKEMEASIVEESVISMTDNLTSNGFKYVFGYKNEYFPQYTKSDHSKKVELFKRLKAMNDDLDIDFFDTATMEDDGEILFVPTANMHKTKFESFMNHLPAETIAKYVEDGLLFVDRKPIVTIKKVKT